MNGQQCDVRGCPAPAMCEVRWYASQLRLYFCLHHARHLFPNETDFPGLVFTYDTVRL